MEKTEQRGEREEGRAGMGWGRSCRVLGAMGRTQAFTLREVGALKGCGQRRDGACFTFFKVPLDFCGEKGLSETDVAAGTKGRPGSIHASSDGRLGGGGKWVGCR